MLIAINLLRIFSLCGILFYLINNLNLEDEKVLDFDYKCDKYTPREFVERFNINRIHQCNYFLKPPVDNK